MSSSRRIAWMVGISSFLLVIYTIMSLSLGRGSEFLNTFGNLLQCVLPLVANAGLLLNAGSPHWRRNFFWMLIAMSCALWMIGQFQWTYYEVYLHKPLPVMYGGDVLFFLRGIPMMAAIALRPHRKRGEIQLRFGYLDFVLLLTWWTFLYAFAVLPWMYSTPAVGQYNYNYNLLTINVAIASGRYYTGSLYDLPLISNFLWFALAGVVAHQNQDKLDAPSEYSYDADTNSSVEENVWPARLAMAAVISLPVFAIYTLRFSHDDPAVRDFRLMTTLIASVPLALLIFLRTHLADRDRSRLLAQSEQSIENLKRLQAQIVQSEKLVSLGQLAAGAAHEINNPLAAILGFSDLLADDPTVPEKARTTASKIRDQARRTKTLVGNLLSFARQVPAERTLLDINTVVNNAVQLRALD